ncbi:MAG: D-aminoacylase, partial [Bacteroidota bacterium]
MKYSKVFLLSLSLCALSCQPSDVIFDVLIINAKVVDGTGNPWFYGDVGIEGERIAAIGKLKGRTAKRVIDASGKIVVPG